MDIRIRNQKELDKIFETVDSIYGFFVSALPLQINLYLNTNFPDSWGMRFNTPMQRFDLGMGINSIIISISRYEIRETKYFRTRIERYL